MHSAIAKIYGGVLFFSILLLVGSWAAVVVIDALNLMDLGNRLIERSNRNASLFVLLFEENRPIEWAQWLCLMTTCLATTYISAIEYFRSNKDEHLFFLLFAVLFALMLIEDAGNIRHGIVRLWLSTEFLPNLAWFGTLFIYTLLSIIPLWALAKYGVTFIRPEPIYFVFGLGFMFYFLAAVFSATGAFGGWYVAAGNLLNDIMFDGRIIYVADYGHSTGYWIMDYLIEETLELIGAISFLTFSYFYYLRVQMSPQIPPSMSAAGEALPTRSAL